VLVEAFTWSSSYRSSSIYSSDKKVYKALNCQTLHVILHVKNVYTVSTYRVPSVVGTSTHHSTVSAISAMQQKCVCVCATQGCYQVTRLTVAVIAACANTDCERTHRAANAQTAHTHKKFSSSRQLQPAGAVRDKRASVRATQLQCACTHKQRATTCLCVHTDDVFVCATRLHTRAASDCALMCAHKLQRATMCTHTRDCIHSQLQSYCVQTNRPASSDAT
jgi:hypothetical protein